jgi:hypothetical protein
MASPIPTFVHPTSEAFTALSTSAALTYDGSHTFTQLAATDTIVGTNAIDYTSYAETNDVKVAHLRYVDSTITLGTDTRTNTTIIASYQNGALSFEEQYLFNAHMYGYTKCHSFGRCAPAQRVGSTCKGGKGYCYESSTGTLECGRGVTTSRRFSSVEVDTYTGAQGASMYRCPRGTPAQRGAPTNIEITARRFLIAGCMLTSDPSYSPSAEVHVPAMCTTPADYLPGCIFPGAQNFAPGAYTPTFCQYKTLGCTSPTAVNFNSRATEDDGSCIQRVTGCTVNANSYHEVEPGTPAYESGFLGVPLRHVGVIAQPQYPTVTNYMPNANVLSGCVVAVEGCMDSTAKNYNPFATINSNTWCVPVIQGCMMEHTTINFDPSVTVSVVASCQLYRVGCMDPTAVNFDQYATVPAQCYNTVYGCLDVQARNFGCSARGQSDCATLSGTTVTQLSGESVTVHSYLVCVYSASSNAVLTQEELADPSNAALPVTVVKTVTLTGTVSDYPCGVVEQMKTGYCALAALANCGGLTTVTIQDSVGTVAPVVFAPGGCTGRQLADSQGAPQVGKPSRRLAAIQGGSQVVASFVTNLPAADAVTFTSALDTNLATQAQATTAFSAVSFAAGTGGVVGNPAATVFFPQVITDDDDNIPLIVGASVGGAVGAMLLCFLIYYMMKKKSKYPTANVVPA